MAITHFRLTEDSKLSQEDIELLKKLKDRPINTDDIPDLTDEQLKTIRRPNLQQKKRA